MSVVSLLLPILSLVKPNNGRTVNQGLHAIYSTGGDVDGVNLQYPRSTPEFLITCRSKLVDWITSDDFSNYKLVYLYI